MSIDNIEFSLASVAKQRLVRHIMTADPCAVDVGASLDQAARLMEQKRISSLLVHEAGTTVAILTERDVIRALGQGVVPEAPVTSVMTRNLITVREDEEVHAAYHSMALHGIRHLVVVDESGRSSGIISETDFRKHRGLESFVGVISVSGAMSQSYLSLPGTCSILDAARQMQQSRVSCVVVADNGKQPRGIVTERDMVRLFRRQEMAATLGEVMTSPVVSVFPDTPLMDAVQQMQALKIRHLVVVEQDGALVGILNEHDTVSRLEDEYIEMLQQLVIRQARELNEDKFRAVINQLPHKILVKDLHSTYISCNESYAADLGLEPDAIAGKTDFDFFSDELAQRYRADDARVMATGEAISIEEPYQKGDNRFWIHTAKSPMRDSSGKISGVVAIFHDITEKKAASEELSRKAWALAALSECNRALVFAGSEAQLLQNICVAITRQNRYLLAWVGWAEHDAESTVAIAAASGSAISYLEGIQISWADNALGNGPTGRSIRLGRTEVNNDSVQNPAFLPWLERAERFGLSASLSLPFRIDGRIAGALVVYAGERNAFQASEVGLFEELADNLGYGLTARRTRLAYEEGIRQKAALADQLERSLEDALMAISATLEQRDPYTAGHERKVAELAAGIARELGMDLQQVRAIHLAAVVHDLGKIQVPSEILVKPERLNAAEFALIRLHPEIGYNILKTVDFPWPVAEIIRQHHEYLDGSGYPRGLKDGEILQQARVLTVADIVESMSSDRPYRPALGLDEAIHEIGRMRGTKLDPAVVDACIRLLQRGEFVPSEL